MTNIYLQESSQGYQNLRMDALMIRRGFIRLTGEVCPDMSHLFYENMWYANQEPDIERIRVLLDSPGGSVTDGLTMLDMIRNSKKRVSCICTGSAYSMGAVLLAACHERMILPHSKVMIHEPSLMKTGGNASTIRETAEDLLKTNEMLCDMIAAFTGHKKTEIKKMVQKDHYFTAEEAVKFGICDRIAGKEDLWID